MACNFYHSMTQLVIAQVIVKLRLLLATVESICSLVLLPLIFCSPESIIGMRITHLHNHMYHRWTNGGREGSLLLGWVPKIFKNLPWFPLCFFENFGQHGTKKSSNNPNSKNSKKFQKMIAVLRRIISERV